RRSPRRDLLGAPRRLSRRAVEHGVDLSFFAVSRAPPPLSPAAVRSDFQRLHCRRDYVSSFDRRFLSGPGTAFLAHGQTFHPCLSHRRIHLGLHHFRFSLAVDQGSFPQSHHSRRRGRHAARRRGRRAPATDLCRFFTDDWRHGLGERYDRLRGIDDSPRHAPDRRQRPPALTAGVLSCRRDLFVLGGYSRPHHAGARGASGGNHHGVLWRPLLSFSSLPRRRQKTGFMNPAIRTENLTFAYKDRPVLDGVSLAVESGEMVGILGPNGSGKTTLLKIFSAILRGRGEVKVNGRSIETYGKRELSRVFAMVPQESQILFPYTVAEIVLMGRASYHSPLALEGKKDLEVARASMQLTDSLS